MSGQLEAFLLGVLLAAYAGAALHFLRFYQLSRDRFFLLFALAFAVLSVNQLGFLLSGDEAVTPFYVARLAAFLLILAAILHKNVSAR